MKHKLNCAKRQPGVQLFSARDFSVATDSNGTVVINTELKCRNWSAQGDPLQLLVFAHQQPKLAKDHVVAFKSDDLMIIELKTPCGKEYVVTTSSNLEINHD